MKGMKMGLVKLVKLDFDLYLRLYSFNDTGEWSRARALLGRFFQCGA